MKFIPYSNIQNFDSFPKEEFEYFASRVDCIARTEVWVSWIVDKGVKSFILLPDGRVFNYYFEPKSNHKTLIDLGNEMSTHWVRYLQKYVIKKKDLMAKAKKLSRRLNSKNKQIIYQDYNSYLESAYDFCDYIWGAWSAIYIYEPEIIAKYPEKVDIIISVDRPIEYMKMEKDIFLLSDRELVKKYGWLNVYNPFEKAYDAKYFARLRKKLNQNKINEQFKNFQKSTKEFYNFIQTVKDKKLKKKIEIIHEFAWLKTDRVDVWKQAQFYARPFYEYLSKQLDISLRDATNMTIQEGFSYLRSDVKPDLKELKLRTKGFFAYYYKKGYINFISDAKNNNWLKKISSHDKDAVVKGSIACSGKVKGIVKIISTEKDLKKITSKDIFVAKFTYPVFTPYMLKAKAVVTDDGGLTSHAAIITREYKKPCIVGTQFATKVFKDGDVVEVDADKGIIKKIK
jgi:phosphohistidine swiveling domain-containing protein